MLDTREDRYLFGCRQGLLILVTSHLSFHSLSVSQMASTASALCQKSKNGINFTSVKSLAESPDLTSIPSSYTFTTIPDNEIVTDPDDDNDPIPVIDYSLLVTGTPDQRSQTIHDIGKACEQWGFFMLINHTVSKTLMEKMVDQIFAFFNLKEEEKQQYAGKEVTDPIRYGTSFNASMDKVLFWRDFLKIIVHPEFHSPDKTTGFRFFARFMSVWWSNKEIEKFFYLVTI